MNFGLAGIRWGGLSYRLIKINMHSLGKYFIIFGAIIIIAGVAFTFFPRLGFLGKLPGDIEIKRENFTFYFPIATSIVISIAVSAVFWLINFLSKK